MRALAVLVFTMMGYIGLSQEKLNDYKYIIVPKKFDSFQEENQYTTSTLIKHFFTSKGFITVYDDALPDDLASDRCLGLTADLVNNSTMFATKTIIALKDCTGIIVYETMQGESREKKYKPSFKEAITKAMRSLNSYKHTYNNAQKSKSKDEPMTVSFKNDIKTLDKEQLKAMAETNAKKQDNVKTVQQKATPTEQLYVDKTPVASTIKKGGEDSSVISQKKAEQAQKAVDVWYAQPTNTGFQLVDRSPEIRMQLLSSSVDGVFMAKTDTENGMVYKKENSWIFEYYKNGKLLKEKLNLKF